jgi:hypothetical protein
MKILVTGGCSFSVAKYRCWPYHLESHIKSDYTAIHTGISCQGNDLISKKILHQLFKILETHTADQILVGVMWSGPNRKAIYIEKPHNDLPKVDGCPDNPTAVVENLNNWYILNSRDGDINPKGLTNTYYKSFYSLIESYVSTCENILRVQWFLQKANINYFMTTYTGMVLPKEMIEIPEVNYLYNQIDFNYFLPVTGQYEWCIERDGPYPNEVDNHPTSLQHENFTKEVIIPFLNTKKYD